MIIQSRNVWIQSHFVPAQLELHGSKIRNILPYGTGAADIDYGDLRIVPGFIDIHTHGYAGWDTNDATPEGLRKWMNEIPSEGVTGICPTTITQSYAVLAAAVRNVADTVRKGYEGAEILGIHLEGPYLDQKYKGAQPQQHVRRFCRRYDLIDDLHSLFCAFLEKSSDLVDFYCIFAVWHIDWLFCIWTPQKY